MKELIKPVLEQLQGGNAVILCSILQTEGSTPRGPGAKMAVFADGTTCGTVGGGSLELQVAARARSILESGFSEVRSYCLKPDGDSTLKMVCGGSVIVGLAFLNPENRRMIQELENLSGSLAEGRTAWLETRYRNTGEASLRCITGPDIHKESPGLPDAPVLTAAGDETLQLEPVRPGNRVWLFGGGHVGRALVPVLTAVDFPVTVYDEREALAKPENHPLAQAVVCAPYEELLHRTDIGAEDYVVVMTPGHEADYLVLSLVLRTPATYIGCIGSKRKVAFVNEKLKQAGFTEADLGRIHSPIGLPIGARTPAEIAVSIAAEMIQHRSKN